MLSVLDGVAGVEHTAKLAVERFGIGDRAVGASLQFRAEHTAPPCVAVGEKNFAQRGAVRRSDRRNSRARGVGAYAAHDTDRRVVASDRERGRMLPACD